MDYNKDISIGRDEWIKWIDFDVEKAQPLDIDHLIEPIAEFWKKLETECVAECCGIDAFSFWPEEIKNAKDDMDIDELSTAIDFAIDKLSNIQDEVIVSSHLNQLMNRNMFLELLKHIENNIKST